MVCQVNNGFEDHEHQPDSQSGALHHEYVPLNDSVHQPLADAGPGKKRLDDNDALDQIHKLYAEAGRQWLSDVAQAMLLECGEGTKSFKSF
ncbi:hypothetical protein PSCICG_24710 [Pseudomonas cichorii]|nr:hypothetical protein PSCICG_24710 [Pseudomonas cichorii]